MNQGMEMASEYKCLLSKLEELIRHYKIAKKNDKNNVLQDRVKNKCNEFFEKLKAFPGFEEVQQVYRYKVESAFREMKPPAAPIQKSSRQNIQPPKVKQPEFFKKNAASSSVSSYSAYSSQSYQPSNNISFSQSLNIKKEMPIIQETPKTPLPSEKSEKSKSQYPNFSKSYKEQVKPQIQTPKIEITNIKIDPINDSVHSEKSNISEIAIKKDTSISMIQNQKLQKEKSQGSQGSLLGLLDQNQSDSDFFSNLRNQKSEEKVETPPVSLNFQSQKEDDSEKYSEVSGAENTIDTIVKFCTDNKEKLNTEILFNEDLFDYIRDEQGELAFLIGVNKPQGKKIQKLYACTMMKFSNSEVQKCDDLFEKETRDFKNNIRTPIGLIIKGDNASAIKPQHIKFLINLQCPYIIILVLKDFQQLDGVLCYFQESAINKIRITPRKQLGQCAEELAKKTYALPYNEKFLPQEKTRYVITKVLNRTIITNAESAPNAITISDNQCIREEKNSFNYKLHSKFLATTKPEYSIYYVNNGIVNARIGFKEFDQFKKEALTLQPKVPAIFSINLPRDNMPVKKQFFDVLVQCNKIRDTSIFLNFSNISVKKTIIVALKSDVTLEMLEKIEPIQYKFFEKDTAITHCMLVITKNNSKEFEADGKNELIEIKSK